MKQSIYNRVVNLDNNNVAVYNTLTGALSVFEQDEYKHYFENDISKLTSDELECMKRNTFFVSDDTDELASVLFKRQKQILTPTIPTYRVLVTTACNARCSYCFEKGIEFVSMDKRVADAVIEFILKESQGCPKIKVQWFGGEPMLNLDIIGYITEGLNDRFDGDIMYSMITNGSLLTISNARELVRLGIKKIQITLDGDKAVYEERKSYVDKNITFETIWFNIGVALAEGLSVVVRVNYDKSTMTSATHLINSLGRCFSNNEKFSCYPFPIYGTYNSRSQLSTGKEQLLFFQKLLVKVGIIDANQLFRSSLGVKDGPCMAYSSKGFFISPTGELFKCSIDMKDNVGNVFDGVRYNKKFFEWCNLDLSEACRSCDLLPVCQGGCRAGALGKLPVTCMRDKDLVDDLIKLMIPSDIKG